MNPGSENRTLVVLGNDRAYTAWQVYEYRSARHNKFWKIRLSGKSTESMTAIERWWGKLGTPGLRKTSIFHSAVRAQTAMQQLIDMKVRKGYTRVDDEIDTEKPTGRLHGGEAMDERNFLERLRAKVKKQWGAR